MLDTSNNLTLQQINYEEEEEEQSLSAISQIKYEDDYSFLNQFSFNGDHLALSRLRFQPKDKKFDIEFYEDLEDSNINEKLQERDKMSDIKNHRKIGTMTFRQNNQIKQPIKLPLARFPIIMKVQSDEKQILHGQLSKKVGQSNISLFDKQGNKKGSFQYYIQAKRSHKIMQQQLEEDDTLNSHDFIQEYASIKKQSNKKVAPIIGIKEKKIDVSKRTTIKTQTLEMEQKKHRLHSSDEQDENKSEKSEIDYLGYENHSKLEERVAEYRLPMERKNIIEASRVIDYQSLKKNMEELGIAKNHQIQSILLQRKRKHPHSEPKQIEQVSKQMIYDDINPTTQIVTQTAQVSFQDFSSQAEESRPEFVQCGVGTYTPLPSRLNEETFKTSRISKCSNKSRKQSKHQKGKQEYPRVHNISDTSIKEQQPALKSSHMPRTHFARNKLAVDSSFQVDSLKNQPLPKQPSHDRNLSMSNRVYEIRVNENNQRTGSKLSKGQDWSSLKQSSSHRLNLSDSCQQSVLYPQVDITVNNLSVNFHRKSFGAKMVQLSIAPTTYRTESLSGNNLIWIGKDYLFKGVSGNSQLSVSLKQSTEQLEQTLAQVKIKVSDLIINKKKSYFQTFLLSRKEVVAILIIGFQITKKTFSVSKQAFPLKIARQSHAQTEISRSKTTKIKRSPRKKEQRINDRQEGLPSPRANPIRIRKYKGGKNIKIGRASRFANDDSINVPGPGDYHIESQFSRHALKDF